MCNSFDRAPLPQNHEQDAACEQQADNAEPKTRRQPEKSRQEIAADLGNQPLPCTEAHKDPNRLGRQRPVDRAVVATETACLDQGNDVIWLPDGEPLSDRIFHFADMGIPGGIDRGFRGHAIAEPCSRDCAQHVPPLVFVETSPETNDRSDLVRHQSAGAAHALSTYFDECRSQPNYLEDKRNRRDPEEDPPQPDAATSHDAFSTATVRT